MLTCESSESDMVPPNKSSNVLQSKEDDWSLVIIYFMSIFFLNCIKL